MLCILPLTFSRFLPNAEQQRTSRFTNIYDNKRLGKDNFNAPKNLWFHHKVAAEMQSSALDAPSTAFSSISLHLLQLRINGKTSFLFSTPNFHWKGRCINRWGLKQFVNKWEVIVRWPICDVVRETRREMLQLVLLLLRRLLHYSAGLSWLSLFQVGNKRASQKIAEYT